METESEAEKEMTTLTETVTSSDPSCPLPDVPSNLVQVTLLNPVRSGPSQISRPLLVYVPGMDCTGQGIRRQVPGLVAAGYVHNGLSQFSFLGLVVTSAFWLSFSA